MSDPIAQAAQQLNEHQATEAGTAAAGESAPQSAPASNVGAPVTLIGVAGAAADTPSTSQPSAAALAQTALDASLASGALADQVHQQGTAGSIDPALVEQSNQAQAVATDAALAVANASSATGNVLVNSAPVEVNAQVAAATNVTSDASAETAEPMPRESHLLLLEHKLAAMHAKFKNGERIVIDEFEQILGHIKAVL
jgi:hypothetical protein